jgi:hypothetical protein
MRGSLINLALTTYFTASRANRYMRGEGEERIGENRRITYEVRESWQSDKRCVSGKQERHIADRKKLHLAQEVAQSVFLNCPQDRLCGLVVRVSGC